MPHQEDPDPSDCDRLDEWREWRDARRDSLRDKRDGWREKPRDCLTLPVRAVADRRNDPATLMNTEEIADADLESADITDDFDICLLFDIAMPFAPLIQSLHRIQWRKTRYPLRIPSSLTRRSRMTTAGSWCVHVVTSRATARAKARAIIRVRIRPCAPWSATAARLQLRHSR